MELTRNQKKQRFRTAAANARKMLKPGDRIRVTKYPGTKLWITFFSWDGDCIVSKSGINDYAATTIDRLEW